MKQRTPVRQMMPSVRPEPDVACRGLLSLRILIMSNVMVTVAQPEGPRHPPDKNVCTTEND